MGELYLHECDFWNPQAISSGWVLQLPSLPFPTWYLLSIPPSYGILFLHRRNLPRTEKSPVFHSETRQECWQWGIWGCPRVAYSQVITIFITPHFWRDEVTDAYLHSAEIYISWILLAGIQSHHLH